MDLFHSGLNPTGMVCILDMYLLLAFMFVRLVTSIFSFPRSVFRRHFSYDPSNINSEVEDI